VLRIEFTINNPKRSQVRRRKNKQNSFDWLPLRKGIADICRPVQLSRAANERYLTALAVVVEPTPSHKLLDSEQTSYARPDLSSTKNQLLLHQDSVLR
jgi:hypothetical protein